MPLHQSTKLGSPPRTPIFNQGEPAKPTTSSLDHSGIRVRVGPTALTAEYVADDQPVYDHDVISAEPRVSERPSVYRAQGTLDVQRNPNIMGKVG